MSFVFCAQVLALQPCGIGACQVASPFKGEQQKRRLVDLDFIVGQARDVMPQPVGCRRFVGDRVPFRQSANGGGGIVVRAFVHT